MITITRCRRSSSATVVLLGRSLGDITVNVLDPTYNTCMCEEEPPTSPRASHSGVLFSPSKKKFPRC
jgi:hypothetical protein